jgi:hypothetical protein
VLDERRFQIEQHAIKLRAQVTRFKRAIGHSFGFSDDDLQDHIERRLNEQIAEHKLRVCRCDAGQVDWPKMIARAVNRKPPFDPSPDVEKGFRDALIFEAFMQLIKASPADRNACRMVLVTGDGELRKAVEGATKTAANVEVCKSIDDLRALISAVLSTTLSEADIVKLAETAKHYFYDKDANSGVMRELQVGSRIVGDLKTELATLPAGATRRVNEDKWLVPTTTPTFVKKEDNRIWWLSKVKVRSKAYGPASDIWGSASTRASGFGDEQDFDVAFVASGEPPPLSTVTFKDWRSNVVGMAERSWTTEAANFPPGSTITVTMPPRATLPISRLVAEGVATINVEWSAAVADGKLTAPKIESVAFVDVEWTPVSN